MDLINLFYLKIIIYKLNNQKKIDLKLEKFNLQKN